MTRPLPRPLRTPTSACRVVHTEADHIAGVCASGCPWCLLRPEPPDDIIVVTDDPPGPAPITEETP